MPERFSGFVANGTGSTTVSLDLEATSAELRIKSRWMGSDPLELAFTCDHRASGSHSGVLRIVSVKRGEDDLPLPPAPGPIAFEYVRVPPQPVATQDFETIEEFTLLLWVDAYAYFDDGTQLPEEEYEVLPAQFKPVVEALVRLESP